MPVYTTPPSGRARLGVSEKSSPVGAAIVSAYGLTQPVRTPRRFDNLAKEGYNQQAPVYHAINLIASGCAGIPWVLYQRKGPNRRGLEIDQSPLLDLMQRPNPTQGWGKFFEAYVGYLYIAGNSYVYANMPQKKQPPVELWTLRPDRMRVVPDEKNFVAGYVYEVNSQKLDFTTAQVLHTKTFAPLDDFYGMSPLVVAARNIDTRNAGGDWNLALLQQSGRVPGFFISKNHLADTTFERMREQLIERYTGARNAGIPGLLEDDVQWVPNGLTPNDMEWSAAMDQASRDIAIALGVPPEMLGDTQVKTYASYSEARASFYTETVLPLMDMLRDELNRWLVPMFGANLWLDYDTEDVEALGPLRASRWNQVNVSNFLTVNEKREATGYDAIPGGDEIILLTTNATLDQVSHGEADGASNGASVVHAVRVGGAKPAATQDQGGDTATDEDTPHVDGNTGNAKPGSAGAFDDGMAGAVDAGGASKAKSYDPLDDLLAGKVLHFPTTQRTSDPKAGRLPTPRQPRPSRSASLSASHRRTQRAIS